MPFDKANLLKELVPKSYRFDGMDSLHFKNALEYPFFSTHVISTEKGGVCFSHSEQRDSLTIFFTYGESDKSISFDKYEISLSEYATLLKEAIERGDCFISINTLRRLSSTKAILGRAYLLVYFDTIEVQKALTQYYDKKIKLGGKTMKNKSSVLGLNLEFGIVKDPNIASTLFGIAVKDAATGNWYVYDKEANTRKNMAKIKMGNMPIYTIPVRKDQLAPGKIIRYNGKYCFVLNVDPSKNTIKIMDASDGVLLDVMPEDSIIPGMSIFTEIVPINMASLSNPNDGERGIMGNIMAAICLMQWSKTDKDDSDDFSLNNINDDSFNGLGAALPFLMANGGSFNNNLLPILLLGSSGNGEIDTTQFLLLTQMMSGSDGKISNPFQNIFSTPSPNNSNSAPEDIDVVICKKCNTTYSSDTSFCPRCGAPTQPVGTFCKKCGNKLKDGDIFCRKCGTKIHEAESFCSKCGKKVKIDDAFCSGCGEKLTNFTEESEKAEEKSKPKVTSKKKKTAVNVANSPKL